MCQTTPGIKQFLAVICCNLLTLACGITFGLLVASDSNQIFAHKADRYESHQRESIYVPSSIDQVSFLESPQYICGLIGFVIGCFAIQPISKIVGIKRTIHLLAVPFVIGAIVNKYTEENTISSSASVWLFGFVLGGLPVAIPTFINDISHDKYRGALCSIFDTSFNVGIFITILMQAFPSIFMLVIGATTTTILILFIIALFLLPESPEFLKKRNHEQAIKSYTFYKGSPKTVESDKFLPNKVQISQIEVGKLEEIIDDVELEAATTLSDFCTPTASNAFFISFTSLALSLIPAVFFILFFQIIILKRFEPILFRSFDNAIWIAFPIAQITTNISFTIFVEWFQQKAFYVLSAILAALSFSLGAVYMSISFGTTLIAFSISIWLISYSCMGLRTIPYILTIELFSKKIRQTFLAFSVSFMGIALFFTGHLFLRVFEFGSVGCLAAMGLICAVNAVFGYYFIPETRGKSHQDIMKLNNYLAFS